MFVNGIEPGPWTIWVYLFDSTSAVELPMTSIPSVNLTPWISFGNWLWSSMPRQFFCAPSASLKAMASAVLFDRQPFDRVVGPVG